MWGQPGPQKPKEKKESQECFLGKHLYSRRAKGKGLFRGVFFSISVFALVFQSQFEKEKKKDLITHFVSLFSLQPGTLPLSLSK